MQHRLPSTHPARRTARTLYMGMRMSMHIQYMSICNAYPYAMHMQVRVTQQLNQVFGSHDLSKK